MTETTLTIEHVPAASLQLDERNARTHGRRNIDAIKASLVAFGQRRPLVVMPDRTVIAGNGTLEAIRELGWADVAVTVVPDDWTPEQARAYALADNRTAELAAWDSDVLLETLGELEAAGWAVSDFGFEPGAFDDAATVVEDTVPDVDDVATVTAPGELWRLGDDRLLVGDATEPGDVARVMTGLEADCIFTDPPYNVDYQGGTDDHLTIMNDAQTEAEFERFIATAYELMFDATRPGGAIYVCHPDTGGHLFRAQMVAAGWLLKQCLVWVKDAFVLSRQDYHWQHETILYGWKPGAAHSWYGRRVRSTVLDTASELRQLRKHELLAILDEIAESSTVVRVDRPRRNLLHPTVKPVQLVARLLANSSQRGDVILDPFAGSGTTLVASAQMERRCCLIEKDPRYADVIVERWQQLTGEKATREHD